MNKMSREDRLALLDSEVFQELEKAERIKQAQTLSDKIVQSPSAQQAIRDGIAKALENKDDDGKMDHTGLQDDIDKLTDHELTELSNMFVDAVEKRDLNSEDFMKQFEDEEKLESKEDKEVEDDDMSEVFAYVKSSLTKMAHSAADNGNTEAAYLIERYIQKIS